MDANPSRTQRRGDGFAAGSLGDLVRALDEAPPEELSERLLAYLRARLGARSCTLLLADYSEHSLHPVRGGVAPAGEQAIATSTAGLAYREQRSILLHHHSGVHACIPVSVRAEPLGVLEVRLPPDPRHSGESVLEVLENVARCLGYAVVAARRYTDLFEQVRRRRDLTLAAEIQWDLLPMLGYRARGFEVAGRLEPAYDIAGDTFDYAVTADTVTVSVTDAMGHGLRAALLGSLAVNACRNARRRGEGVVEQAQHADARVFEQFGGEQHVTGVLMQLDLRTGEAVVTNAGHPPPLLVRGDHVTPLAVPPDLPLGLFDDTTYSPTRVRLHPGDRLLLHTDGITEAHLVGGEPFGEDGVTRLLQQTRDLPAFEVARRVTTAVVRHRGGALDDDATVVCLDWHG